jgi:ribosome recycling factor
VWVVGEQAVPLLASSPAAGRLPAFAAGKAFGGVSGTEFRERRNPLKDHPFRGIQDVVELNREINEKMQHALGFFQSELRQLRTGRASTAILEGVMVDYYGTETPINQVANLNVADASLITAQPFDPSQMAAIEKAIISSGLGLNPSNDGRLIRIPLPPLTEERRKELVRVAHEMAEKCRNSIRQARRDGNDHLKHLEKEKEISQDDEKRGHDEMQKLHDKWIGEVNNVLAAKEKDILHL